MITRQSDRGKTDILTPPLLAKNKEKLIVKIQQKAIRLFSKEVVRMHYAKKRIGQHSTENLERLDDYFDKELKKCGGNR